MLLLFSYIHQEKNTNTHTNNLNLSQQPEHRIFFCKSSIYFSYSLGCAIYSQSTFFLYIFLFWFTVENCNCIKSFRIWSIDWCFFFLFFSFSGYYYELKNYFGGFSSHNRPLPVLQWGCMCLMSIYILFNIIDVCGYNVFFSSFFCFIQWKWVVNWINFCASYLIYGLCLCEKKKMKIIFPHIFFFIFSICSFYYFSKGRYRGHTMFNG